jgi:hypothetical protein
LGFILSSSFFQLGLFVFVLSISRLELNLNLINLISRLGNNKTDGGGVQDEEDGIREYGIIPCFAGWVAWLGIHTSLLLWDFSGLVLAWSAGQPASETQRVAGSYTASGWTCLACIRSLLTGTLGSLARLNLARHGTARWQWALFPWSFSWWDPGLVDALAGLVWFGENTAWVAGSCTVCGWAFTCCIRRFLLGLAHWHADSGTGWLGWLWFFFLFLCWRDFEVECFEGMFRRSSFSGSGGVQSGAVDESLLRFKAIGSLLGMWVDH